MKRLILIAALALLPHVASAEVSIDRAHARADARCQHMADTLSRHGLSDRERVHLHKRECREERGRWISGKVWAADE